MKRAGREIGQVVKEMDEKGEREGQGAGRRKRGRRRREHKHRIIGNKY